MESSLHSSVAELGRAAPTEEGFYVVGVGASAGGLQALKQLFDHLPAHTGAAFVIVVHLSPRHESHLVELLQPDCRMPIQQVSGVAKLEPDHVYVIPPNANLNAIDTHLRLSRLEQRRTRRAPIDHFLRTLAKAHGERAIGVVLTGAGSDGALGLRLVKERGGVALVQDPDEAEHDGMPRSAIASGAVDLVLPVRLISEEIVRLCASAPLVKGSDAAVGDDQQAVLDALVTELEARVEQDIGVYRRATLLQRIHRRMRLRHVETLQDYLWLVRREHDEAKALAADLLTHVTEFFSEPVFDRLEQSILPAIVAGKQAESDRLRVWALGCSSGEEAYSIAILLLEETARRGVRPRIKLFATDFTEDGMIAAREGVYPEQINVHVSPQRLDKFFRYENGHYRVSHEVRDLVVFASHNLLRDPPYAHLDLVVAQNLLHDLQPELRPQVIKLFHYSLEPGGVLLLGPKEAIEPTDLFDPDAEYPYTGRRKEGPRRRLVVPFVDRRVERGETRLPSGALALRTLHEQLARPYTLPSVLVDGYGRVVHYSPHAGRYLQLPGGEPTHELLKLAREPLTSALTLAVAEAARGGMRVTNGPIEVMTAGGRRRVRLHVNPASGPYQGFKFVGFEEIPPERSAEKSMPRADDDGTLVRDLQARLQLAHQQIAQLTAERVDERERMATRREEIECTNEELQAVLHELQSAKEELQTMNEELVTLDEENRRRLAELSQLSSDLAQLLESTGIATLFLGRNLEIMRFNMQVAELFNVRHSDRGRPLHDVTNNLLYPELAADARHMLESHQPLEREVASRSGRWYLTRLLPYRSESEETEGAVLTFVDITDRRRAEEALREADRRKDEFLATLGHELRNPLAPISAGLDILQMAPGNAEVTREVRATIARQTQQLVRLVDDLLDVSRVTSGRLRLRIAPVDLRVAAQDAVAAVRPLIDKTGLELRVDLPEQPLLLDADAARLTQVLTNVLNNAARYTPSGGCIWLSAERQDDEAVLLVRDTGMGMSPETLQRAFEPFFSHSDRRPGGGSGMGIGLTLAQRLVEMHGGTITAESAGANQGSEFSIRLPIRHTEAAVQPGGESEEMSEEGRHRTVLVVDDNEDAARTLTLLVRALGAFDVHTAHDGEEALRVAEALRPDVVLLDLGMPEMDGFEVARQLRSKPWGDAMTLVAVTGWGQEKDKQRTREAGFDEHLVKPADRGTLRSLLARHDARRSGGNGSVH